MRITGIGYGVTALFLLALPGCGPAPRKADASGSPAAAATRPVRVTSAAPKPAPPPAVAARAEPETPVTSGEIQRAIVAAEASPAPAAAATRVSERRCGWLSNPTPGNWWLFDGHGEWILATQGGPEVPGFDALPDMSTAGWVETNGHHGYGCACMTLSYEPATRRVTHIAAATPKPLRQCRADRHLPRP